MFYIYLCPLFHILDFLLPVSVILIWLLPFFLDSITHLSNYNLSSSCLPKFNIPISCLPIYNLPLFPVYLLQPTVFPSCPPSCRSSLSKSTFFVSSNLIYLLSWISSCIFLLPLTNSQPSVSKAIPCIYNFTSSLNTLVFLWLFCNATFYFILPTSSISFKPNILTLFCFLFTAFHVCDSSQGMPKFETAGPYLRHAGRRANNFWSTHFALFLPFLVSFCAI